MAKAKPVETKKKECPLGRGEFSEHAKDMTAQIGGTTVVLSPREFASGSFGYYAGDKVVLTINGKPVRCQLGVTVTVIGSKDAPKE